jgi:hypothetical protein
MAETALAHCCVACRHDSWTRQGCRRHLPPKPGRRPGASPRREQRLCDKGEGKDGNCAVRYQILRRRRLPAKNLDAFMLTRPGFMTISDAHLLELALERNALPYLYTKPCKERLGRHALSLLWCKSGAAISFAKDTSYRMKFVSIFVAWVAICPLIACLGCKP